MISFDDAIILAQGFFDNRFEVMTCMELTDAWSFGFKDSDGNPVYTNSLRVDKNTGEVKQWDVIKLNSEIRSKIIKPPFFL